MTDDDVKISKYGAEYEDRLDTGHPNLKEDGSIDVDRISQLHGLLFSGNKIAIVELFRRVEALEARLKDKFERQDKMINEALNLNSQDAQGLADWQARINIEKADK